MEIYGNIIYSRKHVSIFWGLLYMCVPQQFLWMITFNESNVGSKHGWYVHCGFLIKSSRSTILVERRPTGNFDIFGGNNHDFHRQNPGLISDIWASEVRLPEKLINVILLSWNPLFWIVSGDIHQFRTHPNPLSSS